MSRVFKDKKENLIKIIIDKMNLRRILQKIKEKRKEFIKS
jgi:hypothetical protein